MGEDSLESVSDTGDGLHPLPYEVISEFCAEVASKPDVMEPLPLGEGL